MAVKRRPLLDGMGVSFFVVGLLELYLASHLSFFYGWPILWTGAATFWAGIAYAVRKPGWLGKDAVSGQLVLPVLVLIAPFLYWARFVAWVGVKAMTRAQVEVAPGLWVGAWPRKGAPDLAVLDLTAELPRRGTSLRYACFPMLDGAGPHIKTALSAVAQARQWREAGLPVLVHCAYGHGRSALVVAGVLMAEGLTGAQAWARVRAVRPKARLLGGQSWVFGELELMLREKPLPKP